MKKTVLYLLVAAMLLGVFLGGCQDKTGADGTGPSINGEENPADSKPGESKPEESKPEDSKPEEVDPNTLTAEELSVWNERFKHEIYNEEKDAWELNPLYGFFMGGWSEPREIDFLKFIYYFPGVVISDDETLYADELTDLAADPYFGMTLDEFMDALEGMPITRVRVSDVNEVLTKYAGVTLDRLSTEFANIYLEKYDSYYLIHPDQFNAKIQFAEGRREGSIIKLITDFDMVLTIRMDGEGWQLLSYVSVEEEANPNVLTAERLSLWAERFEPDWYNEEEDNWELNPLNGFFMNYWSDPSEIDLGYFIYYFPGEIVTEGYNEPPYDEELIDLAAYYGESVEEFQQYLMTPATRVRASEVNDVLTKYAGVTWDQLTNDSGLHYHEKYDAFYSFHSDMPAGLGRIIEGRRDGDLIMLTVLNDYVGENDHAGEAVLTIRVDGGNWQLLSFMPK